MRFRIKKDKHGYFVEKKGWFFWSVLFYEYDEEIDLVGYPGDSYTETITYFDTEEAAKDAIDEYVESNKPSVIVSEINY